MGGIEREMAMDIVQFQVNLIIELWAWAHGLMYGKKVLLCGVENDEQILLNILLVWLLCNYLMYLFLKFLKFHNVGFVVFWYLTFLLHMFTAGGANAEEKADTVLVKMP